MGTVNGSGWQDPAFLAAAHAWVAAAVGVDPDRLAPGDQAHARPWSTAIAFEHPGTGRLWFKANGPGTAHEPRLLAELAATAPGTAPDVVAVDPGRAWSLTRDAGPTLRSVRPPQDQWPVWERLLPRYAAVQLRLAPHTRALLAAGTPRRSPATLPGLLEELLTELEQVDPGSGGLAPERAARLRAAVPAYRDWCAGLAASGIPDTIQHDDLHAANVCWGGSVAASRVIDWGDASVGHPFGTMQSTLRSVAHHAGCASDDPRVLRVRDAYLEPFTAYAGRTQLLEWVRLAQTVGVVTRALCWRAALESEGVADHASRDFPVRGWVEELLGSD